MVFSAFGSLFVTASEYSQQAICANRIDLFAPFVHFEKRDH
jgi:hypothetical protein